MTSNEKDDPTFYEIETKPVIDEKQIETEDEDEEIDHWERYWDQKQESP